MACRMQTKMMERLPFKILIQSLLVLKGLFTTPYKIKVFAKPESFLEVLEETLFSGLSMLLADFSPLGFLAPNF